MSCTFCDHDCPKYTERQTGNIYCNEWCQQLDYLGDNITKLSSGPIMTILYNLTYEELARMSFQNVQIHNIIKSPHFKMNYVKRNGYIDFLRLYDQLYITSTMEMDVELAAWFHAIIKYTDFTDKTVQKELEPLFKTTSDYMSHFSTRRSILWIASKYSLSHVIIQLVKDGYVEFADTYHTLMNDNYRRENVLEALQSIYTNDIDLGALTRGLFEDEKPQYQLLRASIYRMKYKSFVWLLDNLVKADNYNPKYVVNAITNMITFSEGDPKGTHPLYDDDKMILRYANTVEPVIVRDSIFEFLVSEGKDALNEASHLLLYAIRGILILFDLNMIDDRHIKQLVSIALNNIQFFTLTTSGLILLRKILNMVDNEIGTSIVDLSIKDFPGYFRQDILIAHITWAANRGLLSQSSLRYVIHLNTVTKDITLLNKLYQDIRTGEIPIEELTNILPKLTTETVQSLLDTGRIRVEDISYIQLMKFKKDNPEQIELITKTTEKIELITKTTEKKCSIF